LKKEKSAAQQNAARLKVGSFRFWGSCSRSEASGTARPNDDLERRDERPWRFLTYGKAWRAIEEIQIERSPSKPVGDIAIYLCSELHLTHKSVLSAFTTFGSRMLASSQKTSWCARCKSDASVK
ncbi:Hypothetical protein, putative, partial [Bodo saltans]